MYTYYILYSIQVCLVLYVFYSLFVSCLLTTVLINYQNIYHFSRLCFFECSTFIYTMFLNQVLNITNYAEVKSDENQVKIKCSMAMTNYK